MIFNNMVLRSNFNIDIRHDLFLFCISTFAMFWVIMTALTAMLLTPVGPVAPHCHLVITSWWSFVHHHYPALIKRPFII